MDRHVSSSPRRRSVDAAYRPLGQSVEESGCGPWRTSRVPLWSGDLRLSAPWRLSVNVVLAKVRQRHADGMADLIRGDRPYAGLATGLASDLPAFMMLTAVTSPAHESVKVLALAIALGHQSRELAPARCGNCQNGPVDVVCCRG